MEDFVNTQQLEDRIIALERLVTDHMTTEEKGHYMRSVFQQHAVARMTAKQLKAFHKVLDGLAPFETNKKYDGDKHDAALAQAYAAAAEASETEKE